jgi:aspartyl protease family protein
VSTPEGPWSRPPAKPRPSPPPRRPRLGWLWLACILGVCALAFALAQLFPGSLSAPDDKADLARGVLLVALVASGALLRTRLSHALRSIAVWSAIIALLLIGYSFRGEITDLALRLRSELIPSYPVASAPGEMVIRRDAGGGFYVTGQVNGQPVRFLVDTGASDIVLSPADAQRLGVDLGALQFDRQVETANGPGLGAPYTAETLAIGPIQLTQTPMSVNKAPMSSSLLGMAFFNRLQSFRFEGDRLYLKPKG